MSSRICTVLCVAILAAGCAGTPPQSSQADGTAEGWPAGVPSKAHYERLYQADERNQHLQSRDEYFSWIIRFYQGWGMFPTGWQQTETELLTDVDATRYSILKAKLSYLGELVSGEWAKDNSVRLVQSNMLVVWGRVMRAAEPSAEKEQAVDRVTKDVLALLSGTLGPHAIQSQRYVDLGPHGVSESVRSEAKHTGAHAPDG
jgi:hypothetical protein